MSVRHVKNPDGSVTQTENNGSVSIFGAPKQEKEGVGGYIVAQVLDALMRRVGRTKSVTHTDETYFIAEGRDALDSPTISSDKFGLGTSLRFVSNTGRVLIDWDEAFPVPYGNDLEAGIALPMPVAQARFNSPPDPLARRVTPGTNGWSELMRFSGQGERIEVAS